MASQDWVIRTIVIGYDASKGAKAAVNLARTLARQTGARVVVATSFHFPYSLDAMGERAAEAAQEAERMAQEAVAELQAAGVEASAETGMGPAGEFLVRLVDTLEPDLVVVGRRGHGATASLLLGSTSEYVVRRVSAPVLVAH